MKKRGFSLFLFCTTLLLSSACKKDLELPSPKFENLFNEWVLEKSVGGIGGSTQSPGEDEITIQFFKDGTFIEEKEGERTNKMRFEFEKGVSTYSGDLEQMLRYSDGLFKKEKGIQSFELIGRNSLILRDEDCRDCFEHHYKMK
jgi:hypothetical protein